MTRDSSDSKWRDPAAIFALFAGLMGFAIAAFAPQIFNDGDSWWHLAAGGWMLEHHAVLKSDVFSFTMAGQPWDAQEWLSEILMALSFQAARWTGLHLLFGAATGAMAAIVTFYVRARIAALPAVLVSVVGLASISGSLLARPHILALPLLALWTLELLKAREQQRAPGWWLLGVMLLWANLHGSFAFGLALAAAFALEAMIEAHGIVKGLGHAAAGMVAIAVPAPELFIDEWKAWKGWGLFLFGSMIAATLTPQLLHGLLFPFELLLLGSIRNIGEWAPTDLTHLSPFPIALLGLVYLAVSGKLKLAPLRALILLGLCALALAHVRHQMLFGIIAPMLIAPALGKAWPPETQNPPRWLMPLGAGLLAAMIFARIIVPVTRADDRVTPITALASIQGGLRARPVLNAYDFGGYLIYSGVKVFVDGRTDMYGDEFLARYDLMMNPDRKALTEALAKWHIAWSLLPPGPAASMMDTLPGWHRGYSDAFAVVHIKD